MRKLVPFALSVRNASVVRAVAGGRGVLFVLFFSCGERERECERERERESVCVCVRERERERECVRERERESVCVCV